MVQSCATAELLRHLRFFAFYTSHACSRLRDLVLEMSKSNDLQYAYGLWEQSVSQISR